MNIDKKFEIIFNNYINGNIQDYRAGIKKLSKLNLINFIEYSQSLREEPMKNVIHRVKWALEN